MPRQGDGHAGGCSRGGVRPEPPEDLPVHDEAGAQAQSEAPVHDGAEGDVPDPVHAAAAAGPGHRDQVVPGPRPRHPGRLLRRGQRPGRPSAELQPAVGRKYRTTFAIKSMTYLFIC